MSQSVARMQYPSVPPELVSILHLREGDDGVGDAGPNVRPHHHRYGGPDRDVSGHQANNDGGGGGGGLDQDRNQHPRHHPHYRVVQHSRVGEESLKKKIKV